MKKEKLFGTYLLLVWFFSFFVPLSGQISHGGVPAPWSDEEVPVMDLTGELPPLEELAAKGNERKGILRFAESLEAEAAPGEEGRWKILADGSRVWRLRVIYKGARSLGLTFGRFHLAPGEKVFVFTPDGSHVLGAFTSANNKAWGTLTVQPLPGDEVVVEYRQPSRGLHGDLRLSRVSVGYLDIFGHPLTKDRFFGASGPCNVDINCPEGDEWQEEKRSVIRIFINDVELCTGVLMNTAINDARPYVLSAGHGIENEDDARHSVFVFGYESPRCGGPDGSVLKSISGATLVARGGDHLDFTLVLLSEVPPFTYYPYYAGWDVSGDTPVPPTVTIHHPQGDVKKISVDNDAPVSADYDTYDANTFWKVLQWDVGTTEPGSSGAPLFDAHHRVVGTLSGGDAHCGNSVNDYFQKLSASWDNYPDTSQQLKHWLDPLDFGFRFWTGNDPYVTAAKSCDTLTNIEEGETLIVDPYPGVDGGYWTGHNVDRTTMYAEQFQNDAYITMTGMYIMPGIIQYDSPSDHVTVKVWKGSSQPSELIVSKEVPLSAFRDSVWNFIDFDTLVPVEGNFFAGYEVYYDNAADEPITDQFAVMQTEPRSNYGSNTAFYYQKDLWTAFSGTPGHAVYISLAILPVMCQEIPSLAVREHRDAGSGGDLLVFPNPAGKRLTILPEGLRPVHGELFLLDLTGKTLLRRKYRQEAPELLLPSLRDGLYLIVLVTPEGVFRGKVFIQP